MIGYDRKDNAHQWAIDINQSADFLRAFRRQLIECDGRNVNDAHPSKRPDGTHRARHHVTDMWQTRRCNPNGVGLASFQNVVNVPAFEPHTNRVPNGIARRIMALHEAVS